jgi:hypothetical protein
MSDIDRIRGALPRVRTIAARVGPLHAAWDAIFDGEAILEGRPTLLRGTAEDVARMVADALARQLPKETP